MAAPPPVPTQTPAPLAPALAPTPASPPPAGPEELPFRSALGKAVARAKRASVDEGPEGKEAPASYVVDRRGRKVPVRFDCITERNVELCRGGEYGTRLGAIDGPLVTAEVIRRFRDGMTTRQLDAETVQVCAQRTSASGDYESLAARICVSDLHKRVPAALPEALDLLVAAAADERSVRFAGEFRAIVRRAADAIAARIDHQRDYRLRYFGFQTMLGTLVRPGRSTHPFALLDTQPCERPQHAYMRVALAIHVGQPDGKGAEAPEPVFRRRLGEAFDLYDALSTQLVSQATPTMLNAGTKTPQMSSCFQLGIGDDLDSILSTLKDAGLISKWSGGISFWLHAVRSEGSGIRGTLGQCSGLKHLLRLWNDMQRYVDQGGNRRGAFAATIADHHPDVLYVLQQARPNAALSETGEDLSAADLKYALWVSDVFMETLAAQIDAEERARRGEPADPAAGAWPLFDPDEAPGLHLVYGEKFRALRARYLAEGRAKRTVKAGDIIAEAFKDWCHKGNPYVMFKDAINRKSNMQNVAPICSSNLCVSGDTRVLTRRGHVAIRALEGQTVEVWNGSEWSPAPVRKTNAGAPLVRVTFSSGAQVECTPYHKFYTIAGYSAAPTETRAGELRPGMQLERCPRLPVVEGGAPLKDAYTGGFFSADGHVTRERVRCQNPGARPGTLCWRHEGRQPEWDADATGQCRARVGYNAAHLYGPKKALAGELALHPSARTASHPPVDRITVYLPDDLPPKGTVPHGADTASRLEWFAGLCDGDGCVARNGPNRSVQVVSIDRSFLLEVRLMLQTLGCDPKVAPMLAARRTAFKGREYECKACYRLLLTSSDTAALLGLGWRPRRLELAGYKGPARQARQLTRVVSVEPLGGLHETFCFNEPRRHRGIFNGVIGGQCCEITIPSWSAFDADTFGRFHPGNAGGGEYGVCTLGAVNLAAFVDAKNRTYDFRALIGASGLEVRALDPVIDLNYSPTPECRRSSQRHRPLGVGVVGLADALALLGLPYDSPRARRFARALAAAHYYGAALASAQLAAEKGSYETFEGSPISMGRLQPDLWREGGEIEEGWEAAIEEVTQGALRPADWKGLRVRARQGMRNAYLVAYMPTATSANVVGQNESFEPYTANLYVRKTLKGDFTIINRHLVAALEARGLWDEEMRRDLIGADGSVQELKRVPADIKRMFRTAREMHPESLVRMVQAMAPFVCQSYSLNHFMDKPELPRILRGLVAAWKAGLKTGMYYCHTSAAGSAPKTSVAPGADTAAGGGTGGKTGGRAGGKGDSRQTDCGTACVV